MPEQIPVHPETITTQNGEYQLRVNSRGVGNMCFEISLLDASDSAHPPRAIASTSILHEGTAVVIGGAGSDFVLVDLRHQGIGKALWRAALHTAEMRYHGIKTIALEVAGDQTIDALLARFRSYGMHAVTQYLENHLNAVRADAMEDDRTTSSRDIMTRMRVEIPLHIFKSALSE